MISSWFPADVQRVDLKDGLFAVLNVNLKPYMANKRPKAFLT